MGARQLLPLVLVLIACGSDRATTDMAVSPDLARADLPSPDQLRPDLAPPDQSGPDMAPLPDLVAAPDVV